MTSQKTENKESFRQSMCDVFLCEFFPSRTFGTYTQIDVEKSMSANFAYNKEIGRHEVRIYSQSLM